MVVPKVRKRRIIWVANHREQVTPLIKQASQLPKIFRAVDFDQQPGTVSSDQATRAGERLDFRTFGIALDESHEFLDFEAIDSLTRQGNLAAPGTGVNSLVLKIGRHVQGMFKLAEGYVFLLTPSTEFMNLDVGRQI